MESPGLRANEWMNLTVRLQACVVPESDKCKFN